ncbi:7-carboxy-7-deazaguanine synthase QueE [soil metagenome]
MNSLPLMEHYFTIQGEGFNTGRACYFIRLGGCDVGCVWCDVKDSWDAAKHPQVSIVDMVKLAVDAKANRVVITGGEPLMYDLNELTSAFQQQSIKVFLETSGAYPLTGTWDWICVSPKKFKAPLDTVLSKADELKVIVFNKSDFDWADEHKAMVSSSCKLYLQPEFSVLDKMLPQIIEYVKQQPEWSISLQTHKVMQIP